MGFNDFLDDVGVPGVGSPPPEVQRNVMYGGRPQKKYGFLEGLRDVLGGFNAVKRINDTGFDWREQDAAQQFARDREVEEARQADEDRAVNQIADAYAGAEVGQEPDVSPLLQGIEERRQKFMLDRARGVGKERKSALGR